MKLSVSMTLPEKILGWVNMACQLLILPVVIVLANEIIGLGLNDAELNFVLFAAGLVMSIAIFHRFLWKSAQVFVGNLWRNLRFAAWGFGIYYLGTLLVGLLITWLCPEFSNLNDEYIFSMAEGSYRLIAICVVLCAPITEELLYRGLVFGLLQRRNRLVAYLVSMLVFASIHVIGYIGQMSWPMLLLSVLQYLPASFALAWAYERTDSIWTSILIHMTVNQISISLMR